MQDNQQSSRGPRTIEAEVTGDNFFKQEYQAPVQVNTGPVGEGTHGSLVTTTSNDVVSAQRVAKPRNYAQILQNIKALARASNGRYVYSWEVNDKAKGRKVPVKGVTIKCANAVAREYGNCMINTRVQDAPGHWLFMARFVDIETGYTYERAYQQRKEQGIGSKYDAQRALDMVFQIGQSKAIRNVIVNALGDLCEIAMEEAESGLFELLSKNPDSARSKLLSKLERAEVPLKFVEAMYARTADKWTVRDMVKIYTEVQSIEDGMQLAEDVFPDPNKKEEEVERRPDAPSQVLKVTGQATGGGEDKREPTGGHAGFKAPEPADPDGPDGGKAATPEPDVQPVNKPATPKNPKKRPGAMFGEE